MKKLLLIYLFFNYSFYSEAQNIEWISFEEAIEKFNKEPKEMFIDVYTNWCGWCKKMDQTTFKDPEIVKSRKPTKIQTLRANHSLPLPSLSQFQHSALIYL